MVGIRNRANGRHTGGQYQPDFAGRHFYGHKLTLPSYQLGKGACASCHNGALSGTKFDTGNNGTQRDSTQRKCVTDFWGHGISGAYLLSDL
jgi:hypothetical protein